MKSRAGLSTVMMGVGSLLLIISFIWDDYQSISYYFPLIFLFLTTITAGIFKLKTYHNKTLYIAVASAFLIVMWIVSFIQPLSSSVNNIVYYTEIGLVTLLIIALVIFTFKEWEKSEIIKES